MAVQLFEWVEQKRSEYGNYGRSLSCFVADMHIGTIRVVQAELLTRPTVTVVMHMKANEVWRCDDGVNQAQAYVQTQFLEWFLACNRIAHEWMAEQNQPKQGNEG